jgi:hypothetical protein
LSVDLWNGSDLSDPTEIVQHFAYSGNSLRCKGAAKHIIDMFFGYIVRPSPVGKMGVFNLFECFLPVFAAPRELSGGGVSTLWLGCAVRIRFRFETGKM